MTTEGGTAISLIITTFHLFLCILFRMLFNCTKEGRDVILFLPNKWGTGDFKD